MAKLFLIRIGNYGDDSSYSKAVIAPDDYMVHNIQSGIDCNDIARVDTKYEYVIDIQLANPEWFTFDEDDFKCIERTLRDFHIHPNSK